MSAPVAPLDEREAALAWLREKFGVQWDVRMNETAADSWSASVSMPMETRPLPQRLVMFLRIDSPTPQAAAEACWSAWQRATASAVPCCRCDGPVHEFVIPNDVWNAIERPHGEHGSVCQQARNARRRRVTEVRS